MARQCSVATVATITAAAILSLGCTPARNDDASTHRDWKVYGADQANSKYAPLDDIHPGNLDQLRVIWRWTSPDQEILADHPELCTWAHEATPLVIDGVLYTATSLSQIAALNAGTGETLWRHDPGSWRQGSPPRATPW